MSVGRAAGRRAAAGLSAGLLLGLAVTASPNGTSITVTRCDDEPLPGQPGQLRNAIFIAAPGTVLLLPPCDITLVGPAGEDANASGDLDVAISLSLQGAGPGRTRLLGGGVDRVLHVLGGAGVTVAVSGLTIAGGQVTGAGGGVLVEADTTLILQNVEITGNVASATSASTEGGGGISNQGGRLTLAHATLHGNQTTVGTGGGLRNAGTGTALLANVTVSGNQADSSGGGVAAISGAVTLNNVTVTGNDADHDGNNDAPNGGGLRVVDNVSTRVRLQNSILAGNTRGGGATADDCSVSGTDTFVSAGSNLVQVVTGCGPLVPAAPDGSTGDITGQDASLAPLAANGGRTPTHALLTGSPALDHGDAGCEGTDQRGVLRPQHGRCDVGAFERAEASPGFADFDGDGRADLVTAAASGRGEIRVLAAAGGPPVLTVPAFGPGYRGPLAVAACDLNGDGGPDLVAAGRGPAGPEIRTLDGVTGEPIGPGPLAIAGLAGAGVGGRDPVRRSDHLFLDVGCADVDADGVPDLIVGAAPQAGQAVIRVLSGVSGTPILEIPIPEDLRGGVAVGP